MAGSKRELEMLVEIKDKYSKDLKHLNSLLDKTGDEAQEAGRKAENSFKNLPSTFGNTAQKITAMAAGFMAAVQAATMIKNAIMGVVNVTRDLINNFAQGADEIGKMAQSFNMGVVELQGLMHAAELSGVSVGQMQAAMKRLTTTMYEIKRGTKTYTDALSEMGISLRNQDGTLMTHKQAMIAIAQGYANARDKTTYLGAASKLLGRNVQELSVMFQNGGEGMRGMIEEGEDLAPFLEEHTKIAAEYNDTMKRLNEVWMQFKNAVIGEVLPTLVDYMKQIQEWVMNNREKLINMAKQIGQKIVELIKRIIGNKEEILTFLENLPTIIGNIVNKAGELIEKVQKILGALWKAYEVANKIMNVLGGGGSTYQGPDIELNLNGTSINVQDLMPQEHFGGVIGYSKGGIVPPGEDTVIGVRRGEGVLRNAVMNMLGNGAFNQLNQTGTLPWDALSKVMPGGGSGVRHIVQFGKSGPELYADSREEYIRFERMFARLMNKLNYTMSSKRHVYEKV